MHLETSYYYVNRLSCFVALIQCYSGQAMYARLRVELYYCIPSLHLNAGGPTSHQPEFGNTGWAPTLPDFLYPQSGSVRDSTKLFRRPLSTVAQSQHPYIAHAFECVSLSVVCRERCRSGRKVRRAKGRMDYNVCDEHPRVDAHGVSDAAQYLDALVVRPIMPGRPLQRCTCAAR